MVLKDINPSPSKYIRDFLNKNSRIILAIFLAVLMFRLSQYYYFLGNPFLNYFYLGETLLAAFTFTLVYFVGFTSTKLLIDNIEKAFTGRVNSILNDFSLAQTNRIIMAIRREKTLPVASEGLSDIPQGSVVLDTSTIIDGRILGVIKTGFLDNNIVVTQNVIDELQNMADKKDDLKRAKGRKGLDTLKIIRRSTGKNKFNIIDLKSRPDEVDKSLVEFCKLKKAKIATVDFNLNKTAQIAGVKVLNVNLLANQIKTNILPGETFGVKLIQKGKEKGQGVGYLEDGTMVVVSEAESYIGEYKSITVSRVIQTEAGKMIFAEVDQV